MGEHFENYSETGWANDFLIDAKGQLPKETLGQFRGMLDANNIQEHEAQGFLDAYKNGSESLKQFLADRSTDRVDMPEEQDHVVLSPKKRDGAESEADHHKTAA